jgi:hypothetical protein
MPFRTSKKSRHRRNPSQHAVCSEGETRQGFLSVRDAARKRGGGEIEGACLLAYMRRQAPTRSTEIVRGLYSHAVHGSYSSVAAAAPPPSVVVAGCGTLLSSPCRARGCCLASIAPNQERPAGLGGEVCKPPNKLTGRLAHLPIIARRSSQLTPIAPSVIKKMMREARERGGNSACETTTYRRV